MSPSKAAYRAKRKAQRDRERLTRTGHAAPKGGRVSVRDLMRPAAPPKRRRPADPAQPSGDGNGTSLWSQSTRPRYLDAHVWHDARYADRRPA